MSVAIMVKKKTTVACFLAISVAMIVIISIRSFSTWLENVTATLAATIGVLVAVGVYIYFPEHLCRRCWSPVFQLARRQRQETTRLVPHSHGHSISEPAYTTYFSVPHSTVTTTEPHPSEVDRV